MIERRANPRQIVPPSLIPWNWIVEALCILLVVGFIYGAGSLVANVAKLLAKAVAP